ncbi:MAG: segregation and condensation protein A [Actinomycetota bacterium]
MPHEVTLAVFQGPIDLLLHLITRQRVDIYDVSIATITDEYLRAMASLEETDLETATGFLVVAATLLELKSVRLLPSRNNADEGDLRLLEERDLLLARLVECATFRDAGRSIQVALERGRGFHPRSVSLEQEYADLLPDVELKLSTSDLVAAALRVLVPKPLRELDVSHVSPITASVRDAIIEMTELLTSREAVSFVELCRGARERIEVVVRFLGLLEMFKAGAIELSQDDRFGAIEARWTGDTAATEVLEDVEEYTFQEEGA